MSTHTPGPWMIYEDGEIASASVRLEEHAVLHAGRVKGATIREAMGNAKLIAAAPEMAEALGQMLQLFIALGLANAPRSPQMLAEYPQVIAARTALAKAGL